MGRQAESSGKQVAQARKDGAGGGTDSDQAGGGRRSARLKWAQFRQLRTKWRAKAAKKAAGGTAKGKTRFSPEDVKVILAHRLRRRRYREKIRNAHEKLKAKQKEKE